MNIFSTILLSFVIALIGAIPLGLVNLNVLSCSLKGGTKKAMQIAHGASIIELIYGLIALLMSSMLANYITQNSILKTSLIVFVGVVALFYLFKTEKQIKISQLKLPAFFEGILLNLLSVQVFMFWIIALLYVNSLGAFTIDAALIVPFLVGIWIAKMGVLWMYAQIGQSLISKSNFISKYMNKIIGTVLLFSVAIQCINY